MIVDGWDGQACEVAFGGDVDFDVFAGGGVEVIDEVEAWCLGEFGAAAEEDEGGALVGRELVKIHCGFLALAGAEDKGIALHPVKYS